MVSLITYKWFIATWMAKWMEGYLHAVLKKYAEASFLLEAGTAALADQALFGSASVPGDPDELCLVLVVHFCR